jgi:hypothetical protein
VRNLSDEALDLTEIPGGCQPSPLHSIEQAIAGLRQYQALTTSFDLELLDILHKPMTARECAESTGCRPDLISLLCAGLTSLGFLEKTGDQYCTTEFSRRYFTRDAPFPQENAIAFQRRLAGLWLQLPDILKSGPVTYNRAEMFRDAIIPSMADNCRCGLLQQVTRAVAAIPEFRMARRLLDLGGGHGLYSIAFCMKNPELEAVVFDLPPVTSATRDFIARYHATRVSTLEGDFFKDPIGYGYDIIFSSSNPGGKVPSLIPKIADSLNEGGLFINKQVLDDIPADPWSDLEWNLWTFEGVQKKPVRYTFDNSVPLAEYNRRLEDHGFEIREIVVVDSVSSMTIAQKTS